jgi:hypothetical protein
MRTTLLSVLTVLSMSGYSETPKSTTARQELTVEQKAQVRQMLLEKGLLTYKKSPLIGRKASDEQTLLSLADGTVSRTDGSATYYFQVWREDRALDYDGPADEGDGGVSIEVANGVIVESSYVVAEF